MAVLYGLIANLAINEQIDQQIVNKNIVYLILQSLEIELIILFLYLLILGFSAITFISMLLIEYPF